MLYLSKSGSAGSLLCKATIRSFHSAMDRKLEDFFRMVASRRYFALEFDDPIPVSDEIAICEQMKAALADRYLNCLEPVSLLK
jgi:hypothetical protein